jgi:cytochrome c-type biogenesis protein CcmH/NrfG
MSLSCLLITPIIHRYTASLVLALVLALVLVPAVPPSPAPAYPQRTTPTQAFFLATVPQAVLDEHHA